ncbi:phosphotransferase [Patulibacter minatonensis]|uniref:phosphotransferase n=1 Tax=Patulibacter minatonensis TaxID=298163 RepID=UPI00146FA410|nr:phosphotransferase [Patulibacter minatonensis]
MSTVEAVVGYEAVTPEWLTEVLTTSGTLRSGARVTNVVRSPCGTGQLADSYRFALSYDQPDAGPASVVGKFASEDEASRAFGQQSGQYRNEIRFYQQLADELAIAVPVPVHAALAENETDFVLLMQDLTPARVVDQLEGCTPDEAALVMDQQAALHASSWDDPRLAQLEWLQGTVAGWGQITDGFDATIAAFPEAFGSLIPEADLAEAAKLVPLRDAWKRELSTPRCLWHNDLRADNVLFDAQAGEIPIAVLDWQGVTYGNGTIDLAYFLATSLTTEDRRAHERDLVARYHEGLLSHGVSDYTLEQCWDDYRVLAIHPLQTGVFGLGAVKRSERGDRMWCNWIDRSAAMTRDLDSFALLATR